MNRQKRHKPEEIILLLRECDASHLSQEQFCQQKQISVATLHRWRKKYGMMDVEDAKRLKALEKENSELKKMYADAMLGTGSMPSRTRMERSDRALEKKL